MEPANNMNATDQGESEDRKVEGSKELSEEKLTLLQVQKARQQSYSIGLSKILRS